MDFSISSKWNASESQATFFEMLSACSASFLADMTRISKGMNHRDCDRDPCVYTLVSFRQRCLRNGPICRRVLGLMASQQRKGNRIPRGDVTCIIGMQMVSAVVNREQSRGVARVPQNHVEIENIIEFSAAAYPVVDLLPHDFFLGTIKGDRGRSFERTKNAFSNGGFVVPMTRISF